jgi:hypothetical protein
VPGGHDEPHGEPGQPAEPATSTSASQPAAGADRPA